MFKILREIKWYIKKEWFYYLIVFIFSVLGIVFSIIQPRLLGDAIDLISLHGIKQKALIEVVVKLLSLALGIYLTTIVYTNVIGRLFHRLYYYIRINYLKNILRLDATFFEEYQAGDLMSRATSDTRMITHAATRILFAIFEAITMIGLSAIMMSFINVKLMVAAILPLPIIFIVVLVLRPKISANWRLVRRRNSDLNNMSMESVSNVRLIRAFVREKEDYNRLANCAKDCYQIERKSVLMQATIGPVFRLITLISQGVALIYGSFLVINQEITPGQLITFNIYLSQFTWPLFQLGNQITFFAQGSIAIDRINEILNAEPDIIDRVDSKNLEDFEVIEFNNLSFRYPKDQSDVIRNINLKIKKGQTIGIVGKTGSGKSTLVRQLLRQFPIEDEALLIDGESVNNYKKESIRQKISYVPQEHILFSRTIEENVDIGSSLFPSITVDEAVSMADFKKDLDFLPYGMETIVGEYGVTLSGGQKQRLSIARAFLKNAEVLILDDSLSAVDGATEANILRNIDAFRKNKTTIIVAHRLTAVESADHIIVLDKGEIIEEGNHDQLMARQGWYYHQYILQQMEESINE